MPAYKLEERMRVTVCPSFDKSKKVVVTCKPGYTANDFERAVCSKLGILSFDKLLTGAKWDAEIDFEDVSFRKRVC